MISALMEAAGRPVSRETFSKIEAYIDRLKAENGQQNLISPSTIDSIWTRHILDSAQLLRFEPQAGATWIDIGSGAGLPGIVIALLARGPIVLVEPRRLRAQFLCEIIQALNLSTVSVIHSKAERVQGRFDVITARAVAPLGRLLGMTRHLAHEETIWILPKGKSAKSELAEAQRSWQYEVRSERSSTDPEARILVLSKVKAKQ